MFMFISEDKYGDAKDADFRSVSTQGNERQAVTGERKADAAPHNIPWRHMTVAERKRLEWARERGQYNYTEFSVRISVMDNVCPLAFLLRKAIMSGD